MAQVNSSTVKQIANSIKINLKPSEVKLFTISLESFVKIIKSFSGINTEKVRNTVQVINTTNIMREDEVLPSLSQKQALLNAHKSKNGYFVVTRVLKDE